MVYKVQQWYAFEVSLPDGRQVTQR
jgi:hypothetical protein